jgi:hypothetical protein
MRGFHHTGSVRRIALLSIVLAGCGGTSELHPSARQTLRLNWHESDAGLTTTVRSIAVTANGWRVEASVTNRRPDALDVLSLHRMHATRFGLIVSRRRELPRTGRFADLRTPFFATRATPPVPTTLRPGESWRGSFSGPGRPPRGVFLRVTFGRFVPPGRLADAFALVSRHVVRLAS